MEGSALWVRLMSYVFWRDVEILNLSNAPKTPGANIMSSPFSNGLSFAVVGGVWCSTTSVWIGGVSTRLLDIPKFKHSKSRPRIHWAPTADRCPLRGSALHAESELADKTRLFPPAEHRSDQNISVIDIFNHCWLETDCTGSDLGLNSVDATIVERSAARRAIPYLPKLPKLEIANTDRSAGQSTLRSHL